MPRRSDPIKQREWSERLQRFEKSSQTVADFCRAEAVSQPSFYHWKRKLAGGGRHGSVKRRQRSATSTNSASRFRPVVVAPPADVTSAKVWLPSGALIELGDDLLVIERVVNQLLQYQADREADRC